MLADITAKSKTCNVVSDMQCNNSRCITISAMSVLSKAKHDAHSNNSKGFKYNVRPEATEGSLFGGK